MRTVDLFAGCGGLSLGFQNAGFEIVAAIDRWNPAIEVYRNNFQHPIFNLDISDTEVTSFVSELEPEVIIGGPPCQDFSSAGSRNENLGRAELTLSFVNIVAAIKPQWFVMENVERITKSKVLKQALKIMTENHYSLTSMVLNSSYCGVPQARKRYFLVGELGNLKSDLGKYLLKNQAKKQMTVFDYLQNDLNIEYYYRHPRSYQRRGIFSIYEPSPTIRGVNRPIPKNYRRHPGDACAPNPYLRPLTTLERSYIQTFPKNFKFQGNKSDLEQMIGNAVPVKLAEYVGRCILEYAEVELLQSSKV
ncbi:DNA cytosine methyltransferase [Oscillatoria sp. FACHB-1406]|uniref:DNA cytosine methyltransferase n=1 Tax=Oscillatoria sp. FACHB-1406 TaxID=2692846 RepID=UPI0016874FC0|nr:DNA cytosine methyltransferase [Oscillatoria sp. FACHB-1406]MBD2577619.1 DNA cytosine methyltransferase [Oscillatoria sp. FACHB-1406]